MKATTWKAVLAALSPSPLFEVIGEFADLSADQRRRSFPKQIDETNDFPVVGGTATSVRGTNL